MRTVALAAALLAASLAGCIVAPPAVVVRPAPPPPHIVRVEPAYPRPAPGYVWEYHPRNGWGWWHPEYGWHQGWH